VGLGQLLLRLVQIGSHRVEARREGTQLIVVRKVDPVIQSSLANPLGPELERGQSSHEVSRE
jgi:hypothetical protein